MRNGKIQSEWAERHIDQNARRHAVWEQSTPGPIELAWFNDAPLDPFHIRRSVEGARSVVLVLGTTDTSRMLLEVTLASLTRGSRLYIYADRTMENSPGIFKGLANRASYVFF